MRKRGKEQRKRGQSACESVCLCFDFVYQIQEVVERSWFLGVIDQRARRRVSVAIAEGEKREISVETGRDTDKDTDTDRDQKTTRKQQSNSKKKEKAVTCIRWFSSEPSWHWWSRPVPAIDRCLPSGARCCCCCCYCCCCCCCWCWQSFFCFLLLLFFLLFFVLLLLLFLLSLCFLPLLFFFFVQDLSPFKMKPAEKSRIFEPATPPKQILSVHVFFVPSVSLSLFFLGLCLSLSLVSVSVFVSCFCLCLSVSVSVSVSVSLTCKPTHKPCSLLPNGDEAGVPTKLIFTSHQVPSFAKVKKCLLLNSFKQHAFRRWSALFVICGRFSFWILSPIAINWKWNTAMSPRYFSCLLLLLFVVCYCSTAAPASASSACSACFCEPELCGYKRERGKEGEKAKRMRGWFACQRTISTRHTPTRAFAYPWSVTSKGGSLRGNRSTAT